MWPHRNAWGVDGYPGKKPRECLSEWKFGINKQGGILGFQEVMIWLQKRHKNPPKRSQKVTFSPFLLTKREWSTNGLDFVGYITAALKKRVFQVEYPPRSTIFLDNNWAQVPGCLAPDMVRLLIQQNPYTPDVVKRSPWKNDGWKAILSFL